MEGAVVGAGTVRNLQMLTAATAAGARFAVSPGFSADMASAATIPLLPGVSTGSEAMAALEAGCLFAKLFPAEAVGGVKILKALYGPFPDLTFCPTGGIDVQNASAYLEQPNVVCVGGSWMTPKDAVMAKDWARIESLARTAASLHRY